ncbi:primase-like DNA-binding domain-containing protein, partial [Bacillus thuringiensis]|uniref:primase-like DNA-binding domain-containing protein n=1 Tax=Bacillus thuringiensis TaxID=1428 RepID=UPI0028528CF3
MGILGLFMSECCVKSKDLTIEAKELYDVYANWCLRNGEHKLKNRALYRIVESKGLKRERGSKNKYYIEGFT